VLEERPELVRHAAMLDPNTAATLTLDEIDALCDELTAAHAEWLPPGLGLWAGKAWAVSVVGLLALFALSPRRPSPRNAPTRAGLR
jgi:hypothetical protein